MGFNLEVVHQPLCAQETQSHSSLRYILAAHNLVEVLDSPAFIAKRDQQHFFRTVFYAEFRPATPAILKCIARDFGYGSGNASLILGIEL